MERKKVVNTFGGLDTDTSVNKYSPEKYIECKNFRTVLEGKNTGHALVNIKGNVPIAEFIQIPGESRDNSKATRMPIRGIGEFEDSVIIFVKSEDNSDGTEKTSVFFIPKRELNRTSIKSYKVSGGTEPYRILTDKSFGLKGDSLVVICRKETLELQKVYFTDGNLPIQFFNAVDENINTQNLNKFKMVPNVTNSSIESSLVSGSLKAGKVGYAYQLYNLYGAESHFSAVSDLINIFNSPLTEKRRVKGSAIDTTTTKGIDININNLDTSFDRIRLVRVNYTDGFSLPLIDVISEGIISRGQGEIRSSGGTYNFTDIGLPGITTYTAEEFNALLIEPIPKTLETKNNYLFLGNVTEDSFDFDYDAPERINHKFGILEKELGNIEGGEHPHSTETYNLDNEKYVGYQRGERYRFGLIGYDDKLRPSFVKNYEDLIFPDYGETGDWANFNLVKVDWETDKTYKRILYPKFKVIGLPKEVKYVQIVRAPRTPTRRSVLDVGFTGFLVPCRHQEGATHMFSGYPTSYRGVPYIYNRYNRFSTEEGSGDGSSGSPVQGGTDLSIKHLEYTSPEILCNKAYSEVGSDLEILYTPRTDTAPFTSWKTSNENDRSRIFNIRHDYWTPLSPGRNRVKIDEGNIHVNTFSLNTSNSIGSTVTVANTVMGIIHAAGTTDVDDDRQFLYPKPDGSGDITLYNQDNTFTLENRGTRGTCMLLKVDESIERMQNEGDIITYGYLARRRKNINDAGKPLDFYGDLDATEFIPCSEMLEVSQGSVNNGEYFDIFSGDTYIGYFDYMRSIWNGDLDNPNDENKNTLAINHSFVTETTVNVDLITSESFNSLLNEGLRGTTWESGGDFKVLQERAGVYSVYDGEGNIKGSYNQTFNLYDYNQAYSRNNNVKQLFTAPQDVIFSNTSPNRIYYTDKKSNGEFADSWLRIRPLNLVDSDSKYGDITRLITFKDSLYCVQKGGVSMIPIEQRELVQTDTPGPLVVGTGDITSNPQYLSTESGSSDYNSIIASRGGLYYYDRNNNKLCRVEQNINFISDTAFISSLLRNTINSEVYAKYDKKYNEVMFNIFPNEILVFNEYKNLFTGIYTYSFQNKISSGKDLFITNEDMIYKTDSGDYGKFMNEVVNSEITLLVNPAANQMAIYDVIELTLEMYERNLVSNTGIAAQEYSEDILLNKPIRYIEIWNEWQQVGLIDLQKAIVEDDTSVVQRFRTWRLNTLVDSTEDEARLRSSSLFIKLIHDNNNNEKIVLHDVVTNIRPTKLR